MPKEKRAEFSIPLLADALEADRVIRKELLALQHKVRSMRFMQQCRSGFNLAMDSIDLLDGVQMMAEETQKLRIN